MSRKKAIPMQKLNVLYLHEMRSTKEISKLLSCSQALVRNRLSEQGIKLRSQQEQIKIDELRNKGVDVSKDYKDISEIKEGEPICCSVQGDTCIYRMPEVTYPDLKGACDYLDITGHSRGCSANECTVYKLQND